MRNISVNAHYRGNSYIPPYVRHGRVVNPKKKANRKEVLSRIPPRFDFPYDVSKLSNDSGVYAHYNDNDRPLYVGSTKNLRKRMQSYYQDDHTHPTKNGLRPHIHKFGYIKTDLDRARQIERNLKKNTVYNHD